MNDKEYLKYNPLHLFKFFHHLIEVKGGDSSGKSVSRCAPTESVSERGGTRTTRGKRPPVTEIEVT